MEARDITSASTKNLTAEDEALGRRRDALTEAIPPTKAKYHDACEQCHPDGRGPHARADELRLQLQDYEAQLARVIERKRLIGDELAERDRLGNATAREEAAKKEYLAVCQEEEQAQKHIDDDAAKRNEWASMMQSSQAKAQAARAQQDAQAIARLPDDVRARIGAVAVDPAAPIDDPAQHEACARAYGEAIGRLDAEGDQLRKALLNARDKKQAAMQRWLEERANVAEAAHRAAIQQYLPVLAAWRLAHEVAYETLPPMPDFKTHADESRGAAMEAARAEALSGLGESVLKRGFRRLAAAAGL